MQNLSYRININVSWGIVLHTLCQRYLLIDGRISVQIMRGWDVLELSWIVHMYSLSYRIVIVSWGIVMHTLCQRHLLLYVRHTLQIMRSRDVLEYCWIGEVHILS